MSLLDAFRRKARPLRNALDNPQRFAIKMFGNASIPAMNNALLWTGKEAMGHPVIYRCVNKIGLAVQDIKWYVDTDPEYKGREKNAKYVKDIQAVLDSPNDEQMASQLRYWLAINKAIYNRFQIKVGVNVDRRPNAIYPLSAEYFKTKYKDNGLIDHYVYDPGGTEQNLPTRRQVDPRLDGNLERAFAYAYITPSLSGAEVGKFGEAANAPLVSIYKPARVISMLIQRADDTASGHPNVKYIIAGEKTLGVEQEDALDEEMNDRQVGKEESGNVLILNNTSVQVHKLDNGMNDIHSKVPMDDMTRMIYAAYGIPLALAGINSADASKFAGNFESSRRSFYEDTIIPNYCGPIAEGLTNALCPPGLKVYFDHDSIPGLGEIRSNKAKTLQGVGFLTQDEKRELCGFPPIRGHVASPNDPDTTLDQIPEKTDVGTTSQT